MGIEPIYYEPQSYVLPLDYNPLDLEIKYFKKLSYRVAPYLCYYHYI